MAEMSASLPEQVKPMLTDAQRAIMAAGVTAAAAPKATMLLFAFHPGRRGPYRAGPAGPTSSRPSPAGR